MDIKPNEIKDIQTIGTLNGHEVKLVGTHGGLWVAVGKRKKSDKTPESLAAASHRAIVTHQLEKVFSDDFSPAMAKSEINQNYIVEDNSKLLSNELQGKGFELFTLSKNEDFEFIIHRYGRDLGVVKAEVDGGKLCFEQTYFKENIDKNEDIMKSLAKAIAKKKSEINVKEHEPKWT